MNEYADTGQASAEVSWTPPTANGNSGVAVTLTSNYRPGDRFPIGVTTVIYTAVDIYGNTANFSFDVIVMAGRSESSKLQSVLFCIESVFV